MTVTRLTHGPKPILELSTNLAQGSVLMYCSFKFKNHMNFTQGLIASGYVLDTENFDDCYVKTDSEGVLHLYQEGEDDNEWNYVTMDDDFNVITEKTFTLN